MKRAKGRARSSSQSGAADPVGLAGTPSDPTDPSLFLAAFEQSPLAMALTDIDGRFLRVNRALCAFLGHSPQDVVGRSWRDFTEPDRLAQTAQQIAELVSGNRPELRLRIRHVRPDASVVWGDLVLRVVSVDPGGAFIGVAQVVDVTEQVRTDQRLLRAEDRYRLLAENASDVVYLRDLSGIVQWVSPSVQAVLGYPPESIVGEDPIMLMADGQAARTEEEAFRARLPLDGTAVTSLSRIRAADGRIRQMSSTTRAVSDQAGEHIGFVVAMRDVTALVQAQLDVESDRQRLRATMDSMIDPLVVLAPVHDASGRVHDFLHVDANEAAARHTHRTVGELVGRTLREVVPGQADNGLFAQYEQVIRTGTPMILDGVAYADEQQGGQRRIFDLRGVKVGEALAVTFRDVTEREAAAAAVAASEALFRTALESAPIGMAVTDLAGRIVLGNPALSSILQRPSEWLVEHSVCDVVDPLDHPAVRRAATKLTEKGAKSYIGQLRMVRADGSIAQTQIAAVLLAGDPAHFLLQVVDMTAELEARAQLAYRAMHDTLTGLRNRDWVMEMLEVDLDTASRSGEPLAVFFVDIDNFKVVNDSLGHAAGDELLQVVAKRIAAVLPPGAQLARFGGDEFVVILPGFNTATEVERIAGKLSDAIASGLSLQGHSILPTASVGIVISRAGSNAESLLRDADAAANRAKESGRAHWHFFDEQMHSKAMTRLTMEGELRRGLRLKEFVAHYQPIVALADTAVVGHEALVRWQHPDRGLLSPAEFLGVAEESGLIVAIGWQVLEQACQVISDNPRIPGGISVNFSGVQLGARDWLSTVVSILGNAGVDPRKLVLEVTETAALSLRESTKRDLRRLRDLGVGIHVDDFGTGYSSISLLRDLPVTGLKLDGSFVADLTSRPSPANALAAGLAGLANGLNLVRIAEGIETWQQAALLAGQGWTHGQGYLFARPGEEVRTGSVDPSGGPAPSSGMRP